jgi:hypothetical protein
MPKVNLTHDEIADIVNALHTKADGDHGAASRITKDDPIGVQRLADTLRKQAERQVQLAERLANIEDED